MPQPRTITKSLVSLINIRLRPSNCVIIRRENKWSIVKQHKILGYIRCFKDHSKEFQPLGKENIVYSSTDKLCEALKNYKPADLESDKAIITEYDKLRGPRKPLQLSKRFGTTQVFIRDKLKSLGLIRTQDVPEFPERE